MFSLLGSQDFPGCCVFKHTVDGSSSTFPPFGLNWILFIYIYIDFVINTTYLCSVLPIKRACLKPIFNTMESQCCSQVLERDYYIVAF